MSQAKEENKAEIWYERKKQLQANISAMENCNDSDQ